MGRKKPTTRDKDDPPQQGGGKGKNKNVVIDDYEYDIPTELSEEQPPPLVEEKPMKKKGKKANSEAKGNDDDDENDEVDVSEVVQQHRDLSNTIYHIRFSSSPSVFDMEKASPRSSVTRSGRSYHYCLGIKFEHYDVELA